MVLMTAQKQMYVLEVPVGEGGDLLSYIPGIRQGSRQCKTWKGINVQFNIMDKKNY